MTKPTKKARKLKANEGEKTLYYKDFAKEQPLLESGLYELGVIRMLNTLAFNQEKYIKLINSQQQHIAELEEEYDSLKGYVMKTEEIFKKHLLAVNDDLEETKNRVKKLEYVPCSTCKGLTKDKPNWMDMCKCPTMD